MTLLGDKIILAMVRTPATMETESLTLYVPAIAREVMNMGVVHAVSEDAAKRTKAAPGDVVLVRPGKGRALDKGMVAQMGVNEKQHWMIYEAEDVLATVDTHGEDV